MKRYQSPVIPLWREERYLKSPISPLVERIHKVGISQVIFRYEDQEHKAPRAPQARAEEGVAPENVQLRQAMLPKYSSGKAVNLGPRIPPILLSKGGRSPSPRLS